MFFNDEENKDLIKEFWWVKYIDINSIYNENWNSIDIKKYYNEIIENIYSNDKNDFLENSKRLVSCFYLNKELTTIILRSLLWWSHSSTANTLSLLDSEIRKDLLEESTYNLNLKWLSDDKQSNEFYDQYYDQYYENSFIKNHLLLVLTSQVYPEDNNDYFIEDIFKDLTNEKFNSIVLDIYIWISLNFWALSELYILNPYFYKKLLEDKKISNKIKKIIVNYEIEERKYEAYYIKKIIWDDADYLTMTIEEFEKKGKLKSEEQQIVKKVDTVLNVDLEKLIDTIISLSKEQIWEYEYNNLWYNILSNLEKEKRESIIKYLLENNYKEAIALLRNKWKHAINIKLIKNLDTDILTKIFKEWLYDEDFIINNLDTFLEKDQFSIFKLLLYLKMQKLLK